MNEHGHAIAGHAHIELHAVTSRHGKGRGQCTERVLGRVPPVASVRESKHGQPISSRAAIPMWSLG